jgi:hypothetical protein
MPLRGSMRLEDSTLKRRKRRAPKGRFMGSFDLHEWTRIGAMNCGGRHPCLP